MEILNVWYFSLFCRRGVVIVKESKTKWIYVVKTVRTYSYGYHKMTCLPQQTSLACICFPNTGYVIIL